MLRYGFLYLTLLVALAALIAAPDSPSLETITADLFFDKVHGAWLATMVANHTGLVHEGLYLDQPSSAEAIDLVLPDVWRTDDDTAIEWVDLHILETYGLDPSYAQVRDEWVDHLNNDIWVATLQARRLMDRGVLPPETGGAELNPEGVWSLDAQLETELFGLIAPGLPRQAERRARFFARVTNSGPAVDVSAFYAALYSLAFFESDVPTLIGMAQARLPAASPAHSILTNVIDWHRRYPEDWRATRRRIRDAYDVDPTWWASRVNFASTIMALLYGDGDLQQTLTIAALAGWDADNNATTSAGLLGLIHGYQGLPKSFRTATDVYFNEDVTGDMPETQTVPEIAARTQALAEAVVRQAGGWITDGVYVIPTR